jgi:putative ABC transport system permease protein
MNAGGVLPLSWPRLALASVALLVVLAIVRGMRLGLSRTVLQSAVRGTAQLFAVGYVLAALFAVERPELVLGVLLIMVGAAARTAGSRLAPVPGLAWLAGAALSAGTGLSVFLVTAVVVRPSPWFSPQYIVPITGMLLGNAMNGASLAGDRFQDELVSRRAEVEARLSLGLSGAESVHPLQARALRAALIPTLNSFAVAGVVQLPGMMTGQILAGVRPDIAVRYQIVIFIFLTMSTAVSTFLFLKLLSKRYLTEAHQLRSALLVSQRPRTKQRYSGKKSSGSAI